MEETPQVNVVVTESAAPSSPPSITDVIEAEQEKAVAVIAAEADARVEVIEAQAEADAKIIEARQPSEELESRVTQCENNVAELTVAILGENSLLSKMAAELASLQQTVAALTATQAIMQSIPPASPPITEPATEPPLTDIEQTVDPQSVEEENQGPPDQNPPKKKRRYL